jgi:hypothetical protein
VPESSGQIEHVDLSGETQLVDGRLHRPCDVLEIRGHVVAPEELVRKRSPAREYLVGQLASQHPPVGDTLAGALLRQCVERAHPHGREREQVAVAAAVDHEGVAHI